MWTQDYAPLANSITLSALVAGLPLYVLFYLLAIRREKGHWAGLWALGAAVVVSILIYRMPVPLAFSSILMGAAFGLFPIMWIVINALFIYHLAVETGQFNVVRKSISGVSEDQRLQVLLIAFSFGALIEGIAGFGTPVALSAAMLVGIGFQARSAVVLALLANTAPVAFGNLGIPIISLAGVIQPLLGVPRAEVEMALSAMVGRQIPFLSLIIPAFLVVVLAGWKRMWEVLPAVLAAGIGFAGTQFVVANFLGPALADVAAALAGMVATVFVLRIWHPSKIWRSANAPHRSIDGLGNLSAANVIYAWSPFILLVMIMVIGSLPIVAQALDAASIRFPWPGLHNQVLKTPPIISAEASPAQGLYPAIFTLDWLRAAGTLALFAAVLSALLLRVSPQRALQIYWGTILYLRWPALTVASVLAIAWVMNYGGLTTTLGLFLTFTGPLFPFFSAFIGWLGVFLTGSDTASNNLFGGLQTTAAQQLGLSPILTSGTNSSGGVCGKMISPQNLVIGAAAVGESGSEGAIFRRTVLWSLGLVALVGVLAMLQAYVLTSFVPTLPTPSG